MFHARASNRLGSKHGGRDARLHVARAAPVQLAVDHLGGKRIACPAVSHRHHVKVAVQKPARNVRGAPVAATEIPPEARLTIVVEARRGGATL